MKKRSVVRYAILLTAALSGCVGVSMHSVHPLRIAITEIASAAPAPNVSLAVVYDYDSYGWFYFFNTPHEVAVVTDSQGIAVVSLAEFRYRTLLKVDGKVASIDKQLIREGGVVFVSSYKATLSPVR